MLCITAYSASSANVCTDTKLQSLLRGRVGPKSFSLPTVDLTVPTSHCWYWPSASIDHQSSEAPAAPYLNSCRLCSLQITLMLRLDPHADPGKDINVCPWDFMLRLNPPENSTCCGRNLKTSVEKIGGESKKKRSKYKRCTRPARLICMHFLNPSQHAKGVRLTGGHFQSKGSVVEQRTFDLIWANEDAGDTNRQRSWIADSREVSLWWDMYWKQQIGKQQRKLVQR